MSDQLKKQWETFEKIALKDAPSQQRREMQKAFYLGAAATFTIVVTIDESRSDEEGAEMIEALNQEVQAFFAEANRQYDPLRSTNHEARN